MAEIFGLFFGMNCCKSDSWSRIPDVRNFRFSRLCSGRKKFGCRELPPDANFAECAGITSSPGVDWQGRELYGENTFM